jgi:hypothetical protein
MHQQLPHSASSHPKFEAPSKKMQSAHSQQVIYVATIFYCWRQIITMGLKAFCEVKNQRHMNLTLHITRRIGHFLCAGHCWNDEKKVAPVENISISAKF